MSRWNTVAIYGVGLIGGSIGMALRNRELADDVVGIGRNPDRLQSAKDAGAITSFITDFAHAPQMDIVVLCTPVQKIAEHCAQVFAHSNSALITDAGSTKQRLVAEIEQNLPKANFVGSHPLAGSDQSGVEHADGELFVDRVVVVTPTANTKSHSREAVSAFWTALGARIVEMSPADHDRALAATSHLPHVLASALAAETSEDHLDLIAGGWRDSTRIAAAHVGLWTQILQENQENVAEALARIQSRLAAFEAALRANDHQTITRLLTAGKQRRDALGS